MKQHERTHRNSNATGNRGGTSPTTSPVSPAVNQAERAFMKVGKTTGDGPLANGKAKSAGGRSDDDGEGESPGLDALATVAGNQGEDTQA